MTMQKMIISDALVFLLLSLFPPFNHAKNSSSNSLQFAQGRIFSGSIKKLFSPEIKSQSLVLAQQFPLSFSHINFHHPFHSWSSALFVPSEYFLQTIRWCCIVRMRLHSTMSSAAYLHAAGFAPLLLPTQGLSLFCSASLNYKRNWKTEKCTM